MTEFTTNLGYALGDTLKAKVRAHNEIGWGLESVENSVSIVA